ncbi:hypothetical protein AWZ03_010653 [Drosophila navojoa]|uniref:Fibronectin type-III domain-containing protein n=1 Tax=Drosophila navojoa TaxID=7232 RepID=A0A484B2I8_DRONA|nr:hypothetical protein AWZ03_010653 [Drosophila navojoa]
MSEIINNNQDSCQPDHTSSKIAILSTSTPPLPIDPPFPLVAAWLGFETRVSKQTVNSVCVDWTPSPESVSVFSIEKYHKRHGWQQVLWASSSPQTIHHLEENFGYRLRIRALRPSLDGSHYETVAISPDIIVKR